MPFSKNDNHGSVHVSSLETLTYLSYLAETQNRGEYRRPCNQRPISNQKNEACTLFEIEFQSLAQQNDEFNNYFEPLKLSISITETSYSTAGLGYRIFPSAIILSQYLINHSHLVRNRKVLELGAGLGLPGLLAHKLHAKRTVLTDCNDDLLRHCSEYNVKSNCYESYINRSISVKYLDWTLANQQSQDNFHSNPTSTAISSIKPINPHILSHQPNTCIHNINSSTSNRKTKPILPLGNETFDIILGTDLLYEKDSAELIPLLLLKHLQYKNPCVHSNEVYERTCTTETSVAIFVSPTRDLSILNLFINNIKKLFHISSQPSEPTSTFQIYVYSATEKIIFETLTTNIVSTYQKNSLRNYNGNMHTNSNNNDNNTSSSNNSINNHNNIVPILSFIPQGLSNLCQQDINGHLYINAEEGEDCVFIILSYSS